MKQSSASYTHSRFTSELKKIEFRETQYYKGAANKPAQHLSQKETLSLFFCPSNNLPSAPFLARDMVPIFQGGLKVKHPWTDTPEQELPIPLLSRLQKKLWKIGEISKIHFFPTIWVAPRSCLLHAKYFWNSFSNLLYIIPWFQKMLHCWEHRQREHFVLPMQSLK